MRKKILFFTAFGAMTILTLSSYDDGPAHNGLNRSGSAGSTAACNGAGCHSANSTSTTVGVALTNSSGQPVTAYTPGATYTVNIVGANNSANLPKFGFQASCVSAANTSVQRGAFSSSNSSISIRTLSGLSFAEHNTPLSGTGSGNNWAYTASFTWVAPAAGSGAVEFFVTLNAVNGNGAVTGDYPNNTTLTVNESSTGIGSINGEVSIKAFPNPTTDKVQITLENAIAGTYAVNVFDMTGRKVANSSIAVNGTQAQASLSTSDWAAGVYHVQISKDGMQRTVAVVKK